MQHVEANGLKLACEAFGSAADPCLILIRGLGTQMIEWPGELIDGFVAGGLRVVIFDNRDAGLSTKLTTGYSLSDMADDVRGLLDALALPAAHVLGISLGGMVAQLVALHYPQRCLSLISVMSSSGNPELPQPSPEVRARLLRTATGRDDVIALDAADRAFWGSPGYPESAAARLAAATRAYERCYFPEGAARQMAAVVGDGSRVDRLPLIRVPALVLHGAADPLIPSAAGEDTARLIPGAELALVPGMGHNIPAALAPEIVRRVVDFIRRRGGRAPP